jgi:membrane-associated phospholipid phosphatase
MATVTRTKALTWLLAVAWIAPGQAIAQTAPESLPPDEPVPLRANFSPAETVVASTVAVTGGLLSLIGPDIFDPPHPGLGVPDRDSLDARISRALYSAEGTDARLLLGVPDVAGAYVLPVLPALYYGGATFSLLVTGQPLWGSRDRNPQHRLMAFIEAMGWTLLVTGVVKHTVGRRRPYTEEANAHPELRKRGSEDNLSFFSGHSSSSFAVGAFLAKDTSRYLRRWTLADSAPATRWLLGTLAPYTLGYGIPALVALSRVVDQQHWPSDVVIGGLTGVLISELVYTTHFDGAGRPRRRYPAAEGQLVPVVRRRGDGTGEMTVAYVARF